MSLGNFTSMDIICLLICGVFSLSGYRRGAINSLISFGGFIASFIIARIFSPVLAEKMLQSPLFKEFIDKINLDQISQNFLEANLIESSEANDLLSQFFKTGESTLLDQSLAGLEEVITMAIAHFISFGIIIILISIVVWSLQFIFSGLRSIPVIGGIDRLLGLGIGLIIGLGFCFLSVWIISIIDLYSGENLNWLNYQNSFFYQGILMNFLNSGG